MRDCKNCPHYVLSENGYYGCEEWECVQEKETLAKEVEIINHLIAMAIMHGSDLGGSYDSNEYELHRAMEDWAKFRGADKHYVIKEKNVTWDNEEWRMLQFVER